MVNVHSHETNPFIHLIALGRLKMTPSIIMFNKLIAKMDYCRRAIHSTVTVKLQCNALFAVALKQTAWIVKEMIGSQILMETTLWLEDYERVIVKRDTRVILIRTLVLRVRKENSNQINIMTTMHLNMKK